MASHTKTQRWLDLIAFLAGRRVPVAVEEIMERVTPYAEAWVEGDDTARASVRRKFERDKDELRDLGIPIETVDYTINYGLEQVQGYLLRSRDFYLPYLRLVSGASAGAAGAGDATGTAEGSEVGTAEGSEVGTAEGSEVGTAEGSEVVGSGKASSRTPRFEIAEDEARAAVEALRRVADLPAFPFRREARSALRKLTFDLGPEVVADGPSGPPVRYLPPPGADDLRDPLRALSDALLRRKEVRFRYYGIHRDEESDRRVEPYGLLFQHSHWYLIGRDLDREDVRVFRVGRMLEPEVNRVRAKSPDYAVPDDFDLADYAGRPSWALPGQDDEPREVVVRFDFPRSLWAERNRHGELVERTDDGGQLRLFRVQDTGPFLRWLLTLGDEARIESPSELRESLAAMVTRVSALHVGDPAGEAHG